MIDKSIYNVVASGSSGNCCIAKNVIMIDCGVSYKAIKDYIKDISIVLLTHIHKDHLNLKTLQRIQKEKHSIRIASPYYLVDKLEGLINIDIIDIGKIYDYGLFKLKAEKLYHDVENVLWKIDYKGYKIVHATDTEHLEGINAIGYDLYAIEHNYDEAKAEQAIIDTLKNNSFYEHAQRSIATHLSIQQAREFIEKNKKKTSQIVELHRSSKYY